MIFRTLGPRIHPRQVLSRIRGVCPADTGGQCRAERHLKPWNKQVRYVVAKARTEHHQHHLGAVGMYSSGGRRADGA